MTPDDEDPSKIYEEKINNPSQNCESMTVLEMNIKIHLVNR